MQPSAALLLSFDETITAVDRDGLVALLSDFDLISIHEDDPVYPLRWTAHFGDPQARDRAAEAIGHLATSGHIQIERTEIEDEDWARRTQADLPAIQIGNVIIAPPWDVPRSDRLRPGVTLVVIEPSRGFGTGHHQSTRLCIVLLQNRDLRGRTMVDVGTGSGVLAITGAKLGAVYVSAIDADPDAIENARENVARNQVDSIVEAHIRDVSDATLAPADVVTANLTGSLLQRHAPRLMALVKPGGALIVAGFTVDERDRVVEAFGPSKAVVEAAEEDGWLGLVLV
ncbi:MAG: 50S ribosomal protein L11 methyltransferase [Vicinamibacterales bacterium]